MTKYWFTEQLEDLPRPVFSRESRQARREALKALCGDSEQLWQKLADRFDEPGAGHRPAASRLQQAKEFLTTSDRGRCGVSDRVSGPSAQACENVRHA